MAATDVISLDEVVRAGRVLFGPGFAADQAWWRDALRSTYRRRALETHPDRARALGRSESDLAREFGALSDAYRILSQMRAGPMPNARHSEAPRPARPARPVRSRPAHRSRASGSATAPPRKASSGKERSSSDPSTPAGSGSREGGPRVRVGVRPQDLPRRRLRFAEFLYYSGRVPWTAFVDAIVWQRAQRPAIGRIAVEFGFLSPESVAEILERRRQEAAQAVPFGEYALRSGYLTSFQLLAALGQQLRLQRRIGEFFVERGLIDPDDVDEIRSRLSRHNVRY